MKGLKRKKKIFLLLLEDGEFELKKKKMKKNTTFLLWPLLWRLRGVVWRDGAVVLKNKKLL